MNIYFFTYFIFCFRFGLDLATWPSGMARDCKSFIPSSNLCVMCNKTSTNRVDQQKISIWQIVTGAEEV